eukprot:gene14378-14502_t
MRSALHHSRWMLITTALVPLHLAGVAHAADVVAAKDDTQVVKEVVVTATRTSQLLSKVPVSVSAFTQETLDKQGIKSFGDIARYTPGVTFDENTKDVAIRGIKSNAGDATTGIYIDDTPIQLRTLGFNSNNTAPVVFDLDRVEVLRGPQGTLFGAGSEGGTVRYITPQPSLTKYSAYGRVEVAHTDNGAPSYEAGVAVGGPLVADKLGFRVSVDQRRDGGYVDRIDPYSGKLLKNNNNWTDTFVWRASVAWAPTEKLLITPTIQYQNRNQHDTDSFWESYSSLSSGRLVNANPGRQSDYDRFYLASIKAEYDLGKVKVISNTSGFNRREYLLNGYEGTLYNLAFFGHAFVAGGIDPSGVACTTNCNAPVDYTGATASPLLTAKGPNLPGYAAQYGAYHAYNSITNVQQNFTQELRVQSNDPDSKLSWVAGVFYTKNRQESIEEIHDPQLGNLMQYLYGEDVSAAWGADLLPNGDDYYNRNVGHSEQTAFFADVTYEVIENLKVTAGLRYAKTHFDITNNATGAQNYGDTGGSSGKNDKPFTPKISVSYQVTPDQLAYATVAKGYRIGGANVPLGQGLLQSCAGDLALRGYSPTTGTPQTYNSDSVVSYEIGSKGKYLDRSLQVSASAFHVDWKNIQYQDLLSSCGILYTTNLGSAQSEGFDLQSTWLPIRNLEVDLAVGYTDAHFTKTGGPVASPLVTKGDTVGGPPWTASIGARWDFTFADRPSYIRVDDEYASKNGKPTPRLDPVNAPYDPNLKTPPQTNFLSLRAGMKFESWDVAVFADNVANSHPELTREHADLYTPIYNLTTFRPLTIGVTGIYRY